MRGGSETEEEARWEDKGTDKLTAGCSDDLPGEGGVGAHRHGPIFNVIKAGHFFHSNLRFEPDLSLSFRFAHTLTFGFLSPSSDLADTLLW